MTDRNSVLREAWQTINDMIVPGQLGGNGCDSLAQRNGVILAANAVLALMHKDIETAALASSSTEEWRGTSDRLRKMAALVLKDYQNAMNCPATSPVYKHLWGTYRDAAAMYAHELAAHIAVP